MHNIHKFFNNKGGIDKGSVYVVVILILLIFGGYILVGGTLPTKLPKASYELVSIIVPTTRPASSSLQMDTFYGATLTPFPTRSGSQPQPTNSPYNPTLVSCGYPKNPQEAAMIWGYTIDSTPASGNTIALKIFYTHQFALSLGPGNVSQMTTHPTDHVTNPNTGNNGPALFLTDITTDATSKAGDNQSGGQVHKPSDIYGTWKTAGAQNPDENNSDLGQGADPWPPANGQGGTRNTNFTSEIIWRLQGLTALDPATQRYSPLQPGHTYRGQIILHDGESQDRTETMCITFKNP